MVNNILFLFKADTWDQPASRQSRFLVRQETTTEVLLTPVTHSYLTIDQTRFQILPAVPGGTGSNNDNSEADILQENKTSVKPKNELEDDKERNEKTINGSDNLFIPNVFNPVPAVPNHDTYDIIGNERAYSHDNKIISSKSPKVFTNEAVKKMKSNIADKYVKKTKELSKGSEKQNILFKKQQRRRFKKCHGKCVQKFCLPVEIISVFTTCSNNCKAICELSK